MEDNKLGRIEKIESNSVLDHLYMETTEPVEIVLYGEEVNGIAQCHIYYRKEQGTDKKYNFNVFDITCSERTFDPKQLETKDFDMEADSEEEYMENCLHKFVAFYYSTVTEEGYTQSGNFGGRVSLFGDKDDVNFDYKEWYNQLFEFKDESEEE